MMRHRKRNHVQIVKNCVQFQQNNCRFKDEACWFIHELRNENTHDKSENNHTDVNKDNPEKVFQKVSKDLDPPVVNLV